VEFLCALNKQNQLSKTKWKSLITSAIYNYWSDRINEEIKYYSTLKYLSPTYEIGKIHPRVLIISCSHSL
jgi:hypothetical protein